LTARPTRPAPIAKTAKPVGSGIAAAGPAGVCVEVVEPDDVVVPEGEELLPPLLDMPSMPALLPTIRATISARNARRRIKVTRILPSVLECRAFANARVEECP